jgi:hypothetical protein
MRARGLGKYHKMESCKSKVHADRLSEVRHAMLFTVRFQYPPFGIGYNVLMD